MTRRAGHWLVAELGQRVDGLLARLDTPVVFFMGFELWLILSICQTTFFWLFVPSIVERVIRYVGLGLVLAYSVAHRKVHPLSLAALGLLLAALLPVAGSFKVVKYGFALLLPISTLFSPCHPDCRPVILSAAKDSTCAKGWKSIRPWAALSASVVVVLVSARMGSFVLIDFLVILFAATAFDFRRLAIAGLLTTTAVLAVVFVGAGSGLIPDYLMSGRVRHMMGFGYALYAPRYLLLITCLILYLEGDELGFPEVLLLASANYLVYKLTDSRLTFGCAMAVLVVAVILALLARLPFTLLRANPLDLAPLRWLCVLAVPACAVVAIMLAVRYDPNVGWMVTLNRVLTRRLELGNRALEAYGIAWFGQRIALVGNGLASLRGTPLTGAYNYVDSIYVQMLVSYGPLVVGLFVLFQMLMVAQAGRERNKMLAVILLMFAAQGIIDDASWVLRYNTFLLYAAQFLMAPLALRTSEEVAGDE